jgi:hypothetical protein
VLFNGEGMKTEKLGVFLLWEFHQASTGEDINGDLLDSGFYGCCLGFFCGKNDNTFWLSLKSALL